MQFIPYSELNDQQRAAVLEKWPLLDGATVANFIEPYGYDFHSDGVTPYVRRPLLEEIDRVEPVEDVAAAPAVAPASGAELVACDLCGTEGFAPRGLAPHQRSKHCRNKRPAHAVAIDAQKASDAFAAVTAAYNEFPIAAAAASKGVKKFVDALAAALPVQASIVRVPLACLDGSPTNPRTSSDQEKHDELCASMRAHGWIEAWPALVRPKVGPGALVEPVDPTDPESLLWALLHPETRQPLLGAETFSRAEAEQLASTKYARRFEIVFAHRRVRAARTVGLEEAPVVVREMPDVEAMELQLIENVQREGLSPLDEAEGFRRLLGLRRTDGAPAHTIHSLAEQVGKTHEHVSRIIMLCKLDGEARKAVAERRLELKIAFELARIPDGEVRAAAARAILNPEQGKGPLRFGDAVEYIRRNCTRNLRDAKFPTDDADLVPARFRIDENEPEGTARYFGGACLECPNNSASAREKGSRAHLLGICGNVACFEAKVVADYERWRAKHNNPEAGKVALTAERNAEVFDDMGALDWRSGLVPLNSSPDAGLLAADKVADAGNLGTWKELTDGKLAEVLIARDPKTGRRVEVVDIESAKAAAELNDNRIFKTSKTPRIPNTAAGDETHKTQTLATKRADVLARQLDDRLQAEAADKAAALGYLPAGGWHLLAGWVLRVASNDALRRVERRRKLEPDTLALKVPKMQEGEAVALVVEVVLADALAAKESETAGRWVAAFGINAEQISLSLASIYDAEHAPAAAVVAPAPSVPAAPVDDSLPHGEGWHATRFARDNYPAAFATDPLGEFLTPDELVIELPATKKQPLEVRLWAGFSVVDNFELWFAGYMIRHAHFAAGEVCAVRAFGFVCRFAAFAEAARLVAARLDSEERTTPKVRAAMRGICERLSILQQAEEFQRSPEYVRGVPAESAPPAPEPEPAAAPVGDAGDPPPKFCAYLTTGQLESGKRNPIVKEYDDEEGWRISLASRYIVWACLIGGVEGHEAAVYAAHEALSAGAGVVTQAGEAIGFTFATGEPEEVQP